MDIMEMELKSRLFSKFDPASKDNDQFGKHLQRALRLSPEQMAACIGKLAELRLVRVESEISQISEGVLPGLKTCGTTVEMRAVQKDLYRWGTSVQEYESEILDTAGVISVHIGLDEGTPRDFYFQMSENDLEDLISQLKAARKDLHALTQFISTRQASGDDPQ